MACTAGSTTPACVSSRKATKTATSFCTNLQLSCTANTKTFYTNCVGFNAGCKVYDLVGSTYVPVTDGFYSDGTTSYYITNGTVESLGQSCPRFFLLDWVKDCLNKDNLSGTWYVSVIDDNTWVPQTNVAYRIPIPVNQTSDCTVAYRSYWVVRFQNTTPVYDIGNADYLEAVLSDMTPTYKLPGFLQDRCSTRANT